MARTILSFVVRSVPPYFNPTGIPNDDPILQILEPIEDERPREPGTSAVGTWKDGKIKNADF